MTASLAHELRTPLAELRSAVDVARRWPDDRELAERALRTAHATAVGLGETVDALLHLARLVAGRETLELERVDVGALIDETWGPLADRAAARGVTLRNDVGPGFAVTTDRRLLRGALGNLLANAAVHGDEGAVVCRGVRENGAVACSCSNATGALDAADLPHLTEPLWRGSTARSERAHAGLGLALVETICETLGARLGLSLAERRLTATLSFPADAATD